MEDNQIKITHFVNPHLFFFKWVRNEGFHDELNELERKIEAYVKESKNVADKKIKPKYMAAVFVPDWNKYVRSVVKRKEKDDHFSVWATDYGVPMLVKASHIITLPHAFKGMSLKNKRIFTGGIENCLPAESTYDINTASSVKVKLPNWTPNAIELTQKILNRAVKLEFEHVEDIEIVNRTYSFGRLMVQRQDGQMVNVVKCLLEMSLATLIDGDFKSELLKIESLYQPAHHAVNGVILDTKTVVSPINTVNNETGFSDDEFSDEELSEEEVNYELPSAEDNEFFNDSVSMFQPIKGNGLDAKLNDFAAKLKDIQLNGEESDTQSNQIVANEDANEAIAKSLLENHPTVKDAKSDTANDAASSENKSESIVKCESRKHNNKPKLQSSSNLDNPSRGSKNRNRVQNRRPTNRDLFNPQQARYNNRHANPHPPHQLPPPHSPHQNYRNGCSEFVAHFGKRPEPYENGQLPVFFGRPPMHENMPNHSMMNSSPNNYNQRNHYNGPKNHTRFYKSPKYTEINGTPNDVSIAHSDRSNDNLELKPKM